MDGGTHPCPERNTLRATRGASHKGAVWRRARLTKGNQRRETGTRGPSRTLSQATEMGSRVQALELARRKETHAHQRARRPVIASRHPRNPKMRAATPKRGRSLYIAKV